MTDWQQTPDIHPSHHDPGETTPRERHGSRPLVLLLLPGLDGTDVFFRPLLKHLPAWVRPMTVSYSNHGPQTYESLLPAVLHQVAGIDRMVVLGSSFAGPLAVMLARAEPHKIAGLILAATFVTSPKPALRRLAPFATAPTIWALRALRRIPVWTRRNRDDPFRIDKAETWRRVSARALAARLRAVARVDVRAQLRQCRLPVACIVFQDDRVVTPSNAEQIRHACPSAEAITLPGDHFGMYHHPARFAEAIVRFIDSARASSDSPAATSTAPDESLPGTASDHVRS